MVLQPVGPESPGTYWMRRAVLVVGVLVVLLLGVRVLAGGSGDAAERGSDDPAPSASATPPASAGGVAAGDAGDAEGTDGGGEASGDAEAGANAGDVVLDPGAVTAPTSQPSAASSSDASSPSGSADASGSAGDEPSAQQSAPVDGSACSDEQIEVTAKSDADSYPAGRSPRLTLTVRNTSESPCTRDLGSAALELVVESGPARVWSSDDCGARSGHTQRTLKAGESWSTSVTWSRKRSAPGCTGRAVAGDGTYVVTARVGTATSEAARFLLQ
ncbi:hypothetical protein [Motilibacter aurantiacus]|uniref:hypothetical protein n=1 Tax=Motilibacter aurantiacus TaxID=2714955 RepID=UPI00140BB57A|nr:hypothetical protein [Motilibacter aurantiacus]NHC44215.1 hypothetical protein [Motilibacter aurantiacus]